jgi:hypothetical protein
MNALNVNTAGSTPLPASMLPITGAEDLTMAATAPQAEPENLTDPGSDDLAAHVPAVRTMRPRDEAFADRVAGERARDLLGADYDTVVAGMKGAPKKVSEKAYNGLCYLADRGKLSTFTEQALSALKASTTLKSSDLVALFKGLDYTDKTARSQAQQQMVVLPILKVAERTGDTLTLILGNMLDLFNAAAVRPPSVKPAKVTKTRKTKAAAGDGEALLSEVADDAHVEEPADTHDTSTVEDLLVGETEPVVIEAVEEDLLVEAPSPTPDFSKLSAEAAIEVMAAHNFQAEAKAETGATKKKASVKKADKKKVKAKKK